MGSLAPCCCWPPCCTTCCSWPRCPWRPCGPRTTCAPSSWTLTWAWCRPAYGILPDTVAESGQGMVPAWVPHADGGGQGAVQQRQDAQDGRLGCVHARLRATRGPNRYYNSCFMSKCACGTFSSHLGMPLGGVRGMFFQPALRPLPS